MASKENSFLLLKDKQNNVTDNGQYNNFTLNHQTSSDAFSGSSKSVVVERKEVLDYVNRRTAAPKKLPDFANEKDSQTKKEFDSWNKSTKDLPPCFNNNCSGKEENGLKKGKNLNTSTLSLHIEAYENPNEANLFEKEGLKENGLIKTGLNAKQIYFNSTSVIQSAFEFSRQQENYEAVNPEIAQYQASQHLYNPNSTYQGSYQPPFPRQPPGPPAQMRHGSREYRYFNREKNTRNGVVVECNWAKQEAIVHAIVDFANHECAYSLRSCFKTRFNPETRSQFYKDERPYEVFENVNFKADENNLVTEEIARNQKKWECFNMGHDIFAVKDVCVFSRDTPRRCYSELAGGVVPFDTKIAKEILSANVPFDCYLEFTFNSTANVDLSHPTIFPVTYRVHSVEHVNPDRFGLVYKTPWLKLTRPVYDVHDPFAAPNDPEKEKNLPGIKAFALTGKKVYVPSRPRWRIFLGHNKISSLLKANNLSIKPHMPLLIDVRFSSELDRYIVYDATVRRDKELDATLTDDNFHKAQISPIPSCPGFFQYRDFGLVFDKYGQMSPFYYSDSKTRILADFTYADPDERAYTPLVVRQVYQEAEGNMNKRNFEGIYIGNNEFYCPYLHFWILQAPAEAELTIGAWYQIIIERVHRAEAIAEVEPIPIPEYDRVPHKIVNGNAEFLFEINSYSFANNRMIVTLLGAVGVTENDLARCEKGINAAGVQFPLAQERPEDRTQVRPRVSRLFKSVHDGMSIAGYK